MAGLNRGLRQEEPPTRYTISKHPDGYFHVQDGEKTVCSVREQEKAERICRALNYSNEMDWKVRQARARKRR